MDAKKEEIVMTCDDISHVLTIGTVQTVENSVSSGTHEYEFSYVFKNGCLIGYCCRTPIFKLTVGSTQENWYMELDHFEKLHKFKLKRFSPKVDNLNVDLDIAFTTADDEVWTNLSATFVSRLAAKSDFEWYTAYAKSWRPMAENVPINIATSYWSKRLLILKGKLIISSPGASDLQSLKASGSSDKGPKLICDFGAMYRNGKSCDITFSVDGEELKAHKCVLESRSPVFAKMFAEENSISQVEVENFDSHQFDCFLLFLYTGEVEDRSRHTVLALHSAATKYQVPDLRKLCCGILGSGLRVDNVCLVLEHSELFDDADLKKMAKSFLLCCFSEVVLGEGWMHLMKEYPKLAIELFSFAAESRTRI